MTTVSTNKAATTANGTTKERKPRTKKALTAKSAGIKIADLLETLSPEDRRKALHIAQTLSADSSAS